MVLLLWMKHSLPRAAGPGSPGVSARLLQRLVCPALADRGAPQRGP